MPNTSLQPIEGTLYRTYEIDGHIFPIYYGYYDEDERGRVEPLPVFPDLKGNEFYSLTGERIVTSVQSPCSHYQPRDPVQPEDWCGDCICYSGGNDEIGLCSDYKNKKQQIQPFGNSFKIVTIR